MLFSALICLSVFATAFSADGSLWRYDTSSASCDGSTEEMACGPAHWGNLGNACSSTVRQSPIDILVDTAVVDFDFKKPIPNGVTCSAWQQYVNDHSYKVSFAGHGCDEVGATYDGDQYNLLQLHFHSPSEHKLDGKFYDAEMHLVHQEPISGALLVLGVFMNVDDSGATSSNGLLQNFWTQGVTHQTVDVTGAAEFDPYSLVNDNTKLYNYPGSLTTPPCSEVVNWFVSAEPSSISLFDLTNLRALVGDYEGGPIISRAGNSNRPVQDISGRTIKTNLAGAVPSCLWDACTENGLCEEGSECTGSEHYKQCTESSAGYEAGCVKTKNGPWGMPFQLADAWGCNADGDCCNSGAKCVGGSCLLSCEASSAFNVLSSGDETVKSSSQSNSKGKDAGNVGIGFGVGVAFSVLVAAAYYVMTRPAVAKEDHFTAIPASNTVVEITA